MKTRNLLIMSTLLLTFCLRAQVININYKDSTFCNLKDALTKPEQVYNLKLHHYQFNTQTLDLSVFSNLEYLTLSYDSLLNLPKGLEKLKRLLVLDISGNNFTLLPEQIALIPNLQELYLNNEKYLDLDQSFKVINKITNLKRLHLDSIPKFKLPKKLELNKNIEYISMRYDGLKTIPNQISNFKHLKTLDVEGNYITTIGRSFLRNKEIESLTLSISPKFRFKKSFLVLSKESSLSSLAISNSNFDMLSNAIVKLDNITTLSLKNDHLTVVPSGIFKMKNLKRLDISGNDFKFIPPSLLELSKLEFLNISDEKYLSYDQTAELIKQLPSLHLLKVGNYDFTFDTDSYSNFNRDGNYIELFTDTKKSKKIHLFKNLKPAAIPAINTPLNNFNAEGFGIRLGW